MQINEYTDFKEFLDKYKVKDFKEYSKKIENLENNPLKTNNAIIQKLYTNLHKHLAKITNGKDYISLKKQVNSNDYSRNMSKILIKTYFKMKKFEHKIIIKIITDIDEENNLL